MWLAKRIALGCALGLLWYVALLLPERTRHDLLGGGGRSPVRMFVLMLVASTAVTILPLYIPARYKIVGRVVVALFLPLVGAFSYSSLVFFVDMSHLIPSLFDVSENPHGPIAGLLGLVFGVYLMYLYGVPVVTLVVYMQAFYVIIPMGLLHGELMSHINRNVNGIDRMHAPPPVSRNVT
ncbi:MAG: hypothetical protein ACKVS6_15220 [Planctomycetota bacterium]